jgi:hypothetical protein
MTSLASCQICGGGSTSNCPCWGSPTPNSIFTPNYCAGTQGSDRTYPVVRSFYMKTLNDVNVQKTTPGCWVREGDFCASGCHIRRAPEQSISPIVNAQGPAAWQLSNKSLLQNMIRQNRKTVRSSQMTQEGYLRTLQPIPVVNRVNNLTDGTFIQTITPASQWRGEAGCTTGLDISGDCSV